MNNPPPEKETKNKKAQQNKKRTRKRKRKVARKNLQKVLKNKKKQGKIVINMSAWAESFTIAATWQLKHQLAYWKARAKALEFENGVLHDIIKKKNYVGSGTSLQEETEVEDENEEEHVDSIEDDEQGEDFEVSEEFIQFLQENAKYKEDARREREKLKEKSQFVDITETLEAGPSEIIENPEEKLKELYGDNWQRIAALESSIQSRFISECDKEATIYWPNIPFNFNFG